MSGDCWNIEIRGGLSKTAGTEQLMRATICEEGFENLPYRVYAMTGEQDIAYPNMKPLMEQMLQNGWNNGDHHFTFDVCPEGDHTHEYCLVYLYSALPEIWG